MKKMEQDLQDARRRHMDDLKNVKVKASNTEKLIESMKVSISALKDEKTKLAARIKEEAQKAKAIEQTKESEIRQLRKKELKANQMAKKLERNYEQQVFKYS